MTLPHLDFSESLKQSQEDKTRRLLGYFYLMFFLVHLLGSLQFILAPDERPVIAWASHLGAIIYILAYFLNRRGFKNTSVFLYIIEQWSHQFVGTHYGGFDAQSLAFWVVAPIIIFLTNYRYVIKFAYIGLVFIFSTYLIFHCELFERGTGNVDDLYMTVYIHWTILLICSYIAYIYSRLVGESELRYEQEHALSKRLLYSILPAHIADRLRNDSGRIVERFEDSTILFADIAGFTELAGRIEPEKLVSLLDEVFGKIDAMTNRRGLLKIKTIGDAYMLAGGLSDKSADKSTDHTRKVARLALELLEDLQVGSLLREHQLKLRIGIGVGPVVAGVIGQDKFAYDLWGDTVNTAARMESHGEPGRIQVTRAVRDRLGADFIFESRGEIEVKGKGAMETFFLVGSAGAQAT